MATNPYITTHETSYVPTQNLYENMIIESIQISGNDYYYIPRTLSDKVDQIFGEDVLSSFNSYAKIELYLENMSGYGGESEMLAKFGMEIRDTASFIVSRKRFTEEVVPIVPESRNEKVKWRPCEGDLIYAPFSQSLFEIKFVEDEYPGFYQLKKKYVWALRCELVQLNNEKFETGIEELDEIFGQNVNRLDHKINTEDGFSFICEDGGNILLDSYVLSEAYNDIIGYGDNSAIKKEFTEIMDFDSSNPFNELF